MWWVAALILAGVAWWWFRAARKRKAAPKLGPPLVIDPSMRRRPLGDFNKPYEAGAAYRERAKHAPSATPSSSPRLLDFKVEVSSGPGRSIKEYAVPQFRISYADIDGVVTDRDIFVSGSSGSGRSTVFHCWCFLRNEERSFRNDRIISATNLKTGRSIKNLAAYMADYRGLNIR